MVTISKSEAKLAYITALNEYSAKLVNFHLFQETYLNNFAVDYLNAPKEHYIEWTENLERQINGLLDEIQSDEINGVKGKTYLAAIRGICYHLKDYSKAFDTLVEATNILARPVELPPFAEYWLHIENLKNVENAEELNNGKE